jgi:peptidoglycan hydrolase-like protein with peptidoglycan-binding domain
LKRTRSSVIALLAVALLAALPAAAATRESAHKTSGHKTRSKRVSATGSRYHQAKTARHGAWKRHGQQGIKEDRARAIQAALIREHYLDGQPTGDWDARTQAAMQKFQADNGWQTKVLPDARALIKLGLGPDNSGLLNPETAAIPRASNAVGK